MYTVGGLYPRLIDADHLDRAATLTCRGKRRRADVALFLLRREEVLEDLQARLTEGRWTPAPLERIRIREPKPRVIIRAPIADRIVHTALVLLMEPVLTRSLRPESYACRPGFGTHRAVLALLGAMRRHRYVLHLDIRSYFPSIDLGVLRGLIHRRIRDGAFLEVVDRVLAAGAGAYDDPGVRQLARIAATWPPPGRGLPIGWYTSQLFAAHVYLDAMDHTIKRELSVPDYVRYVDDFFLFGDNRRDLRRWRTDLAGWLQERRHLHLKHPDASILACTGSLDALGHRVTRQGIEPHPAALRRLRDRVARLAASRRRGSLGGLPSVLAHLTFG